MSECDVCGSANLRQIADATRRHSAIRMCERCGHFFSSPVIDPLTLQSFYDEDFLGDAAAPNRIKGMEIPEYRIRMENKKMADWAIPLIGEYLDVRGLNILDVRSRTGALAQLLTEKGATVVGIDPFAANVECARKLRNINSLLHIPIPEWSRLEDLEGYSFDAVTALTIHSLAHLPSPRRFLERLYDLTHPGSWLFFDEKTILEVHKSTKKSVFDSNPGHYHHFTMDTLEKLFLSAGFDVVECVLDARRRSAVGHIRLVARRPDAPAGSRSIDALGFRCDIERRLSDLAESERELRSSRTVNAIKRMMRVVYRQIS